jgi:signal transduction histidine kinase
LQFPRTASASRLWGSQLFAEPPLGLHAVQFYDDEAFLFETVARFIAAGLKAGEPVVIITTKAHKQSILRCLEAQGSEHGEREGRLVFVDARHLLSQLMCDDMPDPVRLEAGMARLLAQASEGLEPGARVRVFGELADLLWKDGNPAAALRIEELWHEARERHSFAVVCAHAMGNFAREADAEPFAALCNGHSHVLPTERIARLREGERQLSEISVLEQRAEALKGETARSHLLERALRDALRERARVEVELRASLEREQRARAAIEEHHAFRHAFATRFGHDLREPLHTILTTARLLSMHRELSAESQRRLERVQASGVRMQRMIEQLLDVVEDRLSGGIVVMRTSKHDLVPIVTRVIDDQHLANPGRKIELSSEPMCVAEVDAARIEQVLTTLIANALAHGDGARPVRVTLGTRGSHARIAVHNEGPAIEPTLLGRLFEPFGIVRAGGLRPEGLGLGLYLARRILRAHSGTLEVSSSVSDGTRFEAVFPRLG